MVDDGDGDHRVRDPAQRKAPVPAYGLGRITTETRPSNLGAPVLDGPAVRSRAVVPAEAACAACTPSGPAPLGVPTGAWSPAEEASGQRLVAPACGEARTARTPVAALSSAERSRAIVSSA